MTDLPRRALEVLGTHHGAATPTMLRNSGVGRNALRRLVAAEVLVPVYPGVLRLAGTPESLEARCAALCLAYPRGFITGPTGGRLSKLRRMGPMGDIHFAVPHGSNIGPLDGVHLRQTTVIDGFHIQRRADGIVVASAARLAFDLAADLGPIDHLSVVEQILAEERCAPSTLRRIGRQLVHPGRPGSMQFMATMARRLEGGPSASHEEVVVGQELSARGIPVVAQYRIVLGGRPARFDFAVPSVRWAVEVDIHPSHFDLDGASSDRQRDRRGNAAGWQVNRVGPLDFVDLPGVCDELAENYAARCRSVA